MERSAGGSVEQVLVLDKNGNLVCWDCSGVPGRPLKQSNFRLVAQDVIGAFQHADRVLFAVSAQGRTDVYSMQKGRPGREHLYPIMHQGEHLLFGEPKDWRGGRGTYALRLSGVDWLVGDASGADRIAVPDSIAVLGCARSERARRPGVVLLDRQRTRITLQTAEAAVPLLKNAEPIAQASFDPGWNRLAWIGQKKRRPDRARP